MKALSTSELFCIWEEGINEPLLQKTLRLLTKACSVSDDRETGRLSIGERDARLLQLREWMFGPRLRNMMNCPNCAETIEWETNTRDLQLQTVQPGLSVKTFHLEKDAFEVNFRLPDSHDMSKAISDAEYRADPTKLLSDCILDISANGKKYRADELPGSVFEALEQRMREEDPQADISIKINCPVCLHQWDARFDIVSYLWAEINNWAQRIMQEVYLLARAFGWSEKDILDMSARRRQLYIQMLVK
jgi:hypothetical protein